MVVEGTYPFHFGGVSTWCHMLVKELEHVRFTFISLVGDPSTERQFILPSNILDFRPIPIWGVRDAAKSRTSLATIEFFVGKFRNEEPAIEQVFIPEFQRFLHELYAEPADLDRLGRRSWHVPLFLSHDFDRTMRSPAAWQCFLAETQEFFPRVAAQHGFSGAAFSLTDLTTAMRWLYHWLFPLSQRLPQADVVHTAMAGLCSLVAVTVARVRHAIYAHRARSLSA